jgi:hypothetical protein
MAALSNLYKISDEKPSPGQNVSTPYSGIYPASLALY